MKYDITRSADADGQQQQGQEYDLVRVYKKFICVHFPFNSPPPSPPPPLSLLFVDLPQARLLTLQLVSSGAKEHGSFSVRYTRMQPRKMSAAVDSTARCMI